MAAKIRLLRILYVLLCRAARVQNRTRSVFRGRFWRFQTRSISVPNAFNFVWGGSGVVLPRVPPPSRRRLRRAPCRMVWNDRLGGAGCPRGVGGWRRRGGDPGRPWCGCSGFHFVAAARGRRASRWFAGGGGFWAGYWCWLRGAGRLLGALAVSGCGLGVVAAFWVCCMGFGGFVFGGVWR